MSIELPLDAMSTADKLRIIESVWASLKNPEDLPAPDWHREILEQRRQRLESGEATVSSWADAKKRFNELGNAD